MSYNIEEMWADFTQSTMLDLAIPAGPMWDLVWAAFISGMCNGVRIGRANDAVVVAELIGKLHQIQPTWIGQPISTTSERPQ